jgi:Uma2 family endonuclease
MTESEYLAFERESEVKHQLIDGEVFAMAGASWAHNMICAYTTAALINQLGDKPCAVSPSDLRVKVETTRLYTYPDIRVVCGEPAFTDDHQDTLANPTLIIEVLSPSTELYDRGKKFQDYRKLASLREYILISQDSPRVERYTLKDDGTWSLSDIEGLDASIELSSIGCALALADVYKKVKFSNE